LRVDIIHLPYFCTECAGDAPRPIRVRLCCPICTVDVDLYLCPRCAEALRDSLTEALKELRGEGDAIHDAQAETW